MVGISVRTLRIHVIVLYLHSAAGAISCYMLGYFVLLFVCFFLLFFFFFMKL